MVPVSLQLKNFMSYGESAPVLDFEQFRVACLSGRNGQGKSALLDAMTWALWGEARKSAGGHKPDNDLLRIGQREMRVDFVFDLEGDRYRVVRSYVRSASGKTNRPQLEFHVKDARLETYLPLTGSSIRETQQHINNTLGLDYNTFINSAFLLQGRSDEFTKKRPSERKEILTRILDLSRYDLLHETAAGREREAKRREEQAGFEIERLNQSLGPLAEWQQQHEELTATIQHCQEHIGELRHTANGVTAQLAKLDAISREREAKLGQIQSLEGQGEQLARDASSFKRRIEEAEQLLSRRSEIHSNHKRYQELQDERNDLDGKNELVRGLEKQVERLERDLSDKRSSLERSLEKVVYEKSSIQRSLKDIDIQLSERPSVERRYMASLSASKEVASLKEIAEQRQTLQEEVLGLEQELLSERKALEGEIGALQEQVREERRFVESRAGLDGEYSELSKQKSTLDHLRQQLEQTREQGVAIRDQLNKQSTTLSAREEQLDKQEETLLTLESTDLGRCPTCGSELSDDHRARVQTQIYETIAQVKVEVTATTKEMKRLKDQRDSLLEQYKVTQNQISTLEEVPQKLATIEEQVRQRSEINRTIKTKENRVSTLQNKIEERDFGHRQRERRTALLSTLSSYVLDEEKYEQIKHEAAQLDRFKERKQELEELEGRREQIAKEAKKKELEEVQIRQTLDDGTVYQPFREQLERLHNQIEAIGFNQDRFRQVKRDLETLSDAPSQVTALLNAQENREEWSARIIDLSKREATIGDEIASLRNEVAVLESELANRAQVNEERIRLEAQLGEEESRLQTLQVQFGQLSEKLAKANRDATALAEKRNSFNEAQQKRNLFRHVKTAFSKHGIPSLIIEQTLPEVEGRTNGLLERLTDGKMQIRLETLRDKKTGGTKETLDITITDEQGVSRPYETYSGGEAFRVNFALRIALAQLLAERSGVRVRTLVVDEGFGTQDEQGVQSLVEAIQVIQDDFDKIIVITHLSELKEAFPVCIEVQKDSVEGSRFELLGV